MGSLANVGMLFRLRRDNAGVANNFPRRFVAIFFINFRFLAERLLATDTVKALLREVGLVHLQDSSMLALRYKKDKCRQIHILDPIKLSDEARPSRLLLNTRHQCKLAALFRFRKLLLTFLDLGPITSPC